MKYDAQYYYYMAGYSLHMDISMTAHQSCQVTKLQADNESRGLL